MLEQLREKHSALALTVYLRFSETTTGRHLLLSQYRCNSYPGTSHVFHENAVRRPPVHDDRLHRGARPSAANDADFKLKNKTGYQINEVYVSKHTSDAWGRVYHYRITAAFGNRSPPLLTLASTGNITICSTAAVASACPASATTYTTSAPAIILSYGKNGYGGIVNITYITLPAPTSADEIENTNGNAFFVSRTLTAVGAPVGEFDDLVSWISTPVLMSRMVAAQKLP